MWPQRGRGTRPLGGRGARATFCVFSSTKGLSARPPSNQRLLTKPTSFRTWEACLVADTHVEGSAPRPMADPCSFEWATACRFRRLDLWQNYLVQTNQTQASMSGEAMESRILDVQRFNVVGSSGSGKSTFSQKLAKVLGVPHIAMDEIFWQPGWQHLGDEAFALALEAALAPPGWVLDGNYTRTIPVKWPRAQGVIWLDFGFGVTLWRSVTRAMARSWMGEELWGGHGKPGELASVVLQPRVDPLVDGHKFLASAAKVRVVAGVGCSWAPGVGAAPNAGRSGPVLGADPSAQSAGETKRYAITLPFACHGTTIGRMTLVHED